MRIKDIESYKDGTYFATCDGQMVRPIKPISNKWCAITTENDAGKWVTRYEIYQESDPWASCTKARKPTELGVLVDVYEYNDSGKPDGVIGQMLFKPKDIVGTWDEYMLLHGDLVLRRAKERKDYEEAHEYAVSLTQRLESSGFKWPAKFKNPEDQKASSHYAGSNRLWKQNKNAPQEYYVYLTLNASNREDVEYLMRVVEAGIKALGESEPQKEGEQ